MLTKRHDHGSDVFCLSNVRASRKARGALGVTAIAFIRRMHPGAHGVRRDR